MAATTAKKPDALGRKIKEATLRKTLAEAEAAEYEAAERRREHRDHEASANQARVYPFVGVVSHAAVQSCIATLGAWSRRDPGSDITIVFNSPGGDVFDGLALYDYIRELSDKGHKITTAARGMAASMGGILLQAGDERLMGPNCYLMIHEVSTFGLGKVSDIEDEVELAKRLQKRLLGILAERSTMTVKQIESKWKRRDWWVSAIEAVDLGFADRIA
jgi:ATP-dependent Clp endopeptidase proteolytic subunit ClpP